MESVEQKKQRIRRVAREWYAKNKNRIRQKKLDQCHTYRRRLRVGRPTRIESNPEHVMVFNTDTQELSPPPPPQAPRSPPTPTLPRPPAASPKLKMVVEPDTKIEAGSFLVSFE